MDNETYMVSEVYLSKDESDLKIIRTHALINEMPWVAIPSVFVLSLASVVGTGGNILIIASVMAYGRINSKESIFIVSLAISDLFVTVVADPMSITGK